MPNQLSLWRNWVQRSDVIGFRGEFCVSQAGSHDPSNFGPTRLIQAYTVAFEYALSHDRLAALSKFSDDGVYGGLRFEVDGQIVSSDTIDSCLQLTLLPAIVGSPPLMNSRWSTSAQVGDAFLPLPRTVPARVRLRVGRRAFLIILRVPLP